MEARDGILLSEFIISNDVFRGALLVRLKMDISKTILLLANEHHSDQKKCYKRFSYIFSQCNLLHKKRLCQLNARECGIKEDFNQNGSLITVNHFSYAPLFQDPHFLTKMLESNILYDSVYIDILSV